MADKVIAAFAQERGLAVVSDTAMLTTEEGFLFSFGYHPTFNSWGLSVHVDEATYTKEKHKELKQALKPYKLGVAVYNATGLIQMMAAGMTKDARIKKLEESTQALRTELPKLGLAPRQTCHICGQPGCDDSYVQEKIGYPAHSSCKTEKAASILAEVEINQQTGNVFLGLLGALLGGIVGSLPSALTIHFMETVYGLLFALIPMVAYLGYKTFKGVMNRATPFIISIVSILSTVVMMLGYNYTLFMMEFRSFIADQGVTAGELGISPTRAFFEVILSPEYRGDIIAEMAMPLLFCIIGIALAWSYISKNNKHRIKEAQEIMESSNR